MPYYKNFSVKCGLYKSAAYYKQLTVQPASEIIKTGATITVAPV